MNTITTTKTINEYNWRKSVFYIPNTNIKIMEISCCDVLIIQPSLNDGNNEVDIIGVPIWECASYRTIYDDGPMDAIIVDYIMDTHSNIIAEYENIYLKNVKRLSLCSSPEKDNNLKLYSGKIMNGLEKAIRKI